MPEGESTPEIPEENTEELEKIEKMSEELEREGGEEETSEYLFEDEEPPSSTSLDVRALEAMIVISDLLAKAVNENIDPKEIAKRIRKVQETLLRPRRKKVRKSSAKRTKSR